MSGYKVGSNYQEQGGNKWVIGGELQVINGATVLFGEDASSLDVKFFGATTGKYMLWDESANSLYLVGSFKNHHHVTTESYAQQLRTEYNAATGDFFGIDAEAHQYVSRTEGTLRGISMCARNVAGSTLSVSSSITAGYFLLDNDGTLNGSGVIASAMVAKVDAGGVFTQVSHLCSLWLDSTQQSVVGGEHELLYMSNNGATTMDRAIYVYGGNKITNLFELNTVTGMVGAKVDADIAYAHYKKVNVTVDGVAGWLLVGFDS